MIEAVLQNADAILLISLGAKLSFASNEKVLLFGIFFALAGAMKLFIASFDTAVGGLLAAIIIYVLDDNPKR